MNMLTKDAILSAHDTKLERVDVPEWGGAVYVRVMTGAERDTFEAECSETTRKGVKLKADNIRAKLAVRVVCDEGGKRLFADSDVVALGKKSSKALDRIWETANKLSAIREGDLEEVAKN